MHRSRIIAYTFYSSLVISLFAAMNWSIAANSTGQLNGQAKFLAGSCGANPIQDQPCKTPEEPASNIELLAIPRDGEIGIPFVTNDQGSFSIALPAGQYEIKLERPNFNLNFNTYQVVIPPHGEVSIELKIGVLRP